jgi:hypothetical protein
VPFVLKEITIARPLNDLTTWIMKNISGICILRVWHDKTL